MMNQAPIIDFPGVSEVTLLRPAASDTDAVMEMLSRCSRATLFHRFHGLTDGVAYFETVLRDGPAGHTLLAWYRSRCVGVAALGTGPTGIIDLGVLVEDAWQRQGVGTQLVGSLLDSARAQGATTVHADVLGDDRFILEALRQIGPLRVAIEFGSYSVDIGIGKRGTQPSGNSLPVALGTGNGGDRNLDRAPTEVVGRRRGVQW